MHERDRQADRETTVGKSIVTMSPNNIGKDPLKDVVPVWHGLNSRVIHRSIDVMCWQYGDTTLRRCVYCRWLMGSWMTTSHWPCGRPAPEHRPTWILMKSLLTVLLRCWVDSSALRLQYILTTMLTGARSDDDADIFDCLFHCWCFFF